MHNKYINILFLPDTTGSVEVVVVCWADLRDVNPLSDDETVEEVAALLSTDEELDGVGNVKLVQEFEEDEFFFWDLRGACSEADALAGWVGWSVTADSIFMGPSEWGVPSGRPVVTVEKAIMSSSAFNVAPTLIRNTFWKTIYLEQQVFLTINKTSVITTTRVKRIQLWGWGI